MRNSKHVKATPITSEHIQRQKNRHIEDILKQFKDTHLTVTETGYDTETANRRASTQCNNETETTVTTHFNPTQQ